MSLMGMKEVIITEKEADSISCDIDTVHPEYIEGRNFSEVLRSEKI